MKGEFVISNNCLHLVWNCEEIAKITPNSWSFIHTIDAKDLKKLIPLFLPRFNNYMNGFPWTREMYSQGGKQIWQMIKLPLLCNYYHIYFSKPRFRCNFATLTLDNQKKVIIYKFKPHFKSFDQQKYKFRNSICSGKPGITFKLLLYNRIGSHKVIFTTFCILVLK